MLDISGAGAQLPMRSHWKLRPGPHEHKNSEKQCKRGRANSASSNASATGQTQSQQTARQALQDKRPSNRNLLHLSPPCSHPITAPPSRHLKRCRRGGPCRRLQAPVRREEPKGGCGVCAAEGFKGNPHFNPAITRPDPPSHRSLAPVPGCYQVWRRGVPPGVGASVSPASCDCAADGASFLTPPPKWH